MLVVVVVVPVVIVEEVVVLISVGSHRMPTQVGNEIELMTKLFNQL